MPRLRDQALTRANRVSIFTDKLSANFTNNNYNVSIIRIMEWPETVVAKAMTWLRLPRYNAMASLYGYRWYPVPATTDTASPRPRTGSLLRWGSALPPRPSQPGSLPRSPVQGGVEIAPSRARAAR